MPGVKELFESKKQEADEENQVQNYYKKFTNRGPSYFGDMDETDDALLRFEQQAEQEGTLPPLRPTFFDGRPIRASEWEDAYQHLRSALGIPSDSPVPKIPRNAQNNEITPTSGVAKKSTSDAKRKAPDADVDVSEENSDAESKRAKKDGSSSPHANGDAPATSSEDPTLAHARTTAAYIPFLTPENLLPPKMPTRDEMEDFLLGLRKRALVEEYFGNEA